MPNFLDDTGTFTDEFRTSLPTMLGEEHKDMDFSSITDVQTLVKSYADNKAFAGKKLDNVIQKPGENPSDDEKAAYRSALGKAIGAGEKVEDYEFFHADPATLPEGWNYNTDTESKLAALALKYNISKEFTKEASKLMHDDQLADYQKVVAAQQAAYDTAFGEEVNALRTDKDWLGDATPKNLRTVLKSIEAFGSDELKAKVKEAGLYDKASLDNMKDWEKAGIPIQNIPYLLNTGNKLLGAQLPQGEQGGGGSESEYQKNKRLQPDRPELWGPE